MDQIIAIAHPHIHEHVASPGNGAIFGCLPSIQRPVRSRQHPLVENEGDKRNAETGDHQRRQNLVRGNAAGRSEEHTSELQSLMRISYAVFCLKKKKKEQPSELQPQIAKSYHILCVTKIQS